MSVDRSLPGVAGLGFLGECRHEDDDGLVAETPGGEPSVVEGAFELRIEGLGVRAHAVDVGVVGIGRG